MIAFAVKWYLVILNYSDVHSLPTIKQIKIFVYKSLKTILGQECLSAILEKYDEKGEIHLQHS